MRMDNTQHVILFLSLLTFAYSFQRRLPNMRIRKWNEKGVFNIQKSIFQRMLDGSDGNSGGVPPSDNYSLEGEGNGNKKSSAAFALVFSLDKLLQTYTYYLTLYTYPTKIISSCIIGGLGDILIQNVQRSRSKVPKPFDFRRLIVFSTVAAFYIAPVIHIWFNYLDKLSWLSGLSPFNKAAVMMILDQTIGATVINVFFFVAFEMANRLYPPYNTSSKSLLQSCIDSCKTNIWVTLVANWKCWPIINFVNFLFIPADFRVLFSNVISVFWNMFLSSVANRDGSDQALEITEKESQ